MKSMETTQSPVAFLQGQGWFKPLTIKYSLLLAFASLWVIRLPQACWRGNQNFFFCAQFGKSINRSIFLYQSLCTDFFWNTRKWKPQVSVTGNRAIFYPNITWASCSQIALLSSVEKTDHISAQHWVGRGNNEHLAVIVSWGQSKSWVNGTSFSSDPSTT